jgi:hypothetical protein
MYGKKKVRRAQDMARAKNEAHSSNVKKLTKL